METVVKIRAFCERDLPEMVRIWNKVVQEDTAFPQTEPLDASTAGDFFAGQSYCGVAETAAGELVGLYILHPNNVGRCGHICNANYAVASTMRGHGVGALLVRDCMEQAHRIGFRILQFNAVVKTNLRARSMYEKLGFHLIGTVEGGFRMDDGQYADICLYYVNV